MATSKAFRVLAELSRRCLSVARGLPAQTEIVPTHSLLCFSVLAIDMAVAIEDLVEIIERPSCTRLPCVKPWVSGIANVRGRLIPIVDFAAYLGGNLTSPPGRQRVLIVEDQGILVGLTVDQVYGMRHIKANTYQVEATTIPEKLAPYVEGQYLDEGASWKLFRPARVVADAAFSDVAA